MDEKRVSLFLFPSSSSSPFLYLCFWKSCSCLIHGSTVPLDQSLVNLRRRCSLIGSLIRIKWSGRSSFPKVGIWIILEREIKEREGDWERKRERGERVSDHGDTSWWLLSWVGTLWSYGLRCSLLCTISLIPGDIALGLNCSKGSGHQRQGPSESHSQQQPKCFRWRKWLYSLNFCPKFQKKLFISIEAILAERTEMLKFFS